MKKNTGGSIKNNAIEKKNSKKEIELPKTKIKKLKLKHRNLFIIIGVLALILTGLFIFTNDKKEEKTNDNQNINKEVKEEEKKLSIVNENSKSRPYAIMINNIGTARPLQSGLQDAYIMYEMIVEGGLTRYLALFMDQKTERIGSIRSARHYYLDYALENDAIYVHHGQSPQAKSDFSNLGIDRIEVTASKTGWRDKTLNVSSEHTLFTSIEKLSNGLKGKRTEREKELLLDYSVDEINLNDYQEAKIANKVKIEYSSSVTSSYEYDAENKVYNRFVNNKEHKDYVTGKQYTFKNIITYQVENYLLSATGNKGRQGLENIGTGSGYFITNGIAVPITWEKKTRDSQTVYKYKDGKEIVVNDGNTFIQIQPKNKDLIIE